MVICSPNIRTTLSTPHTKCGKINIVSASTKIVGMSFDYVLTISRHVQHTCMFRATSIGRTRNVLPRKITQMMMHVVVKPRVDKGNGLLYRISNHLLSKLQRMQNVASRHIKGLGNMSRSLVVCLGSVS